MAWGDTPIATPAKGATVSTALSIGTPAAGSLLVGFMVGYNGDEANHTFSDNVNGAWTKIIGKNSTAGHAYASMWYMKNAANSATIVTGNLGTGGSYCCWVVHEISGADTTAPFTAGEYNTGDGSTSNPQTGGVVNSVNDSIFVAGVTNDYGGNSAVLTLNSTGTVGTFIQEAGSVQLDGNNGQDASVCHQVVSTSASRAHGWDTGGTAYNSATIIACFKKAAAGGPSISLAETLSFSESLD